MIVTTYKDKDTLALAREVDQQLRALVSLELVRVRAQYVVPMRVAVARSVLGVLAARIVDVAAPELLVTSTGSLSFIQRAGGIDITSVPGLPVSTDTTYEFTLLLVLESHG